MDFIAESLKETLVIVTFVFVMMMLADYGNAATRGRLSEGLKKGHWRRLTLGSFLGFTPGCLGGFMNVSFYMHGLLSPGAVFAGLIATTGDEAFVMLSLFPNTALLLMTALFFLGILGGALYDRFDRHTLRAAREECHNLQVHGEEKVWVFRLRRAHQYLRHLSLARFSLMALVSFALYGVTAGAIGPESWDWERVTLWALLLLSLVIVMTAPEHYLEEHVWKHIAREHLWKTALWTFAALVLVGLLLQRWNFDGFVREHNFAAVLIACAVGCIPQSGPHLLFVMLYAQGAIPFSILFANAFVQDGHAMLPLLSYSWRQAVWMKLLKIPAALLLSGLMYGAGF